MDRAADLAGQRPDQFQSGTCGVVLFNPATIIRHGQTSLAVADARDQINGDSSAAIWAECVLDAVGCNLIDDQAQRHCTVDR